MAAVPNPPEARIILENISWETYERLLAEHPESAGPRFTYDNGMLELMILSIEHEEPNRTLAALVEQVAVEIDISFRRAGSNTFKRADLAKGFEPDSAFYFGAHAKAVRGKRRLDLRIDPPPDLVIEIDVTNYSLPRFPIFAAMRVPEVWRYEGQRAQFFKLSAEDYVEVEHSVALKPLTAEVVTRFLKQNEEMDSTEWMLMVRAWARGQQL